jgi:hypothetical protein
MAKLRYLLAIVPLLAIGAVMLVPETTAQNTARTAKTTAPRVSTFVISDQEGYGTSECLERPGGCGKIIADSFCESKGFEQAAAYRKADPDEVTGSIASERKPPPREPQAYIINCK